MKSTFNILFYVNKSLPSLLIRKQTSIFLWHTTEKCVLGYTLLWNCKRYLFWNVAKSIESTTLFLIYVHELPHPRYF